LPYLQYLQEKLYKPDEVVDLLPLTDDEKSLLIEELEDNDGLRFQQMLVNLGVKRDFDVLFKTKKYTVPQIYEKLGLRNACCRMNFLSPIHVPLQRDAFEEPSKSKQLLDSLSTMDTQSLHLMSPDDMSVSGSKSTTLSDITISSGSQPLPLIPVMQDKSSTFDIDLLDINDKNKDPLNIGSCKVGDITQESSFKASVVIPDELPDLLDADETIDAVGQAVQKRRLKIDVGEGYFVRQEPRKYRAR
jgi:DNA-directed RNA polymerase subunit N (RpoN/RPB10)